MRIFNSLSARSRISVGLVSLLISILCAACIIQLVPDPAVTRMSGRAALCESIALSCSDHIGRQEVDRATQLLTHIVKRNPDLLSAGIRREEGQLVAEIGPHARLWQPMSSDESTTTQVLVPIRSSAERWGNIEILFAPLRPAGLAGWFTTPGVILILFVSSASYLVFYIYLGKMLQHLDPSQAVPKRVRSALDSLAEGLLVIDRDQRIVLANQSFASWVNRPPEKLIGKKAPILPWVADSQGSDVQSYPWVDALESESAQAGVMIGLKNTDGDVRILMANASPVLGHDGQYRGVLVSFDDVTQLEQTRHDLRIAKRVAEDANQAKSDFLARMSHEIRTPMNAILGYTDVLRRGFDASVRDRQDYLDTIHSSGQHLLALINDILDLSKIESGRMDLELRRCSPVRLLRQVVSVFQGKAREKGISLELHCDGAVPETIETDEVRLRQTIMNLVGNAIKFTEKGGVGIVARLKPETGQLEIDVIDSGIGISPAAQKSVFDAFSQADTSITRRFGGTGLGLAISKQLAEALGGDIRLVSKPGVGTRFTIRIATGSLTDIPLISQENALQHIEVDLMKSQTRTQKLNPGRILVADDGASNRKLLELVLGRAGLEVVAVENGKQALEATAESEFDVILMDMQMPVMDGYTATGHLRSAGYQRPIYALTANAMQGDREKCLNAGCTGFLTKPVDIDNLLAELGKIIGYQSSSNAQPQLGALSDARPTPEPQRHADVEQQIQADVVAIQSDVETAIHGESSRSSSADGSPDEPLACELPLDDPEFREIASAFVERFQEQINAMRDALNQRDFDELAQLAHWAKGSGGTAGYSIVTNPATTLEVAARSNDIPMCDKQIAVLAGLCQRMVIPTLTN